MEKNYKIVPFDINRINEEGVKVVTREKHNVKILTTTAKSIYPIIGLITSDISDDLCKEWNLNGWVYNDSNSSAFDLFLQVPIKTRRMTNQELSWWLRDCPQEHREVREKHGYTVYQTYEYFECDADKPLKDCVLIRSNGGEWKEPLIEIND